MVLVALEEVLHLLLPQQQPVLRHALLSLVPVLGLTDGVVVAVLEIRQEGGWIFLA